MNSGELKKVGFSSKWKFTRGGCFQESVSVDMVVEGSRRIVSLLFSHVVSMGCRLRFHKDVCVESFSGIAVVIIRRVVDCQECMRFGPHQAEYTTPVYKNIRRIRKYGCGQLVA